MAVAILVLTGLTWLMHRYIWARLVRDAAWPAPWSTALTVAVFVLAVLIPVAFVAMRTAASRPQRPAGLGGLRLDGIRALPVPPHGGRRRGPRHRRALRSAAVGPGAAALPVAHDRGRRRRGRRAHRHRRTRQRRARVRRAARARAAREACRRTPRVTASCSSPTCTSARRSARGFIETVVRETNALEPDIVVITGDLVDGSRRRAGGARRALARASREGRRLLRDRQPRVLLGRRRVDRAPSDARHPRPPQRARRRARRASTSPASTTSAARRDAARPRAGHRARRSRGATRRAPLVLLAHQPKAGREARAARRRPPALGAHPRRADDAVGLARAARSAARRRALHASARRGSTSAAAPATGGRRCASARRAEITRIELVAGDAAG